MVNSKFFIVKNENGAWIADVLITEDGLFTAISIFGNFTASFKSYFLDDFREYLIGFTSKHFAEMLAQSNPYSVGIKGFQSAIQFFSEIGFPLFHKMLQDDVNLNPEWEEVSLSKLRMISLLTEFNVWLYGNDSPSIREAAKENVNDYLNSKNKKEVTNGK